METVEIFETLLDRMGDGVMLIDRDGAIVSANPACAAILGYSRQALIGLPFSSLVLTEELSLVSRDHERIWSGEGLPARSRRFARKDGTIVTALVDECIVPYGNGGDRRILAIINDRTQRTETAAALHESQQQLRAFFGNTEEAVYLKDLTGSYLTINPAGANMFGRPAIDILFRDDRYLFGDAEAAEIRALDRRVSEFGEPFRCESTVTIRGERRVFSTVRLPFYDLSGKISGVIGITRDLTGRKAAEQDLQEVERHYRSLIEGSDDGVLIMDTVGVIREANDRAAAMLGFPKENLIGLEFEGLVFESDRRVHLEIVEGLSSGGGPRHYECSLIRSNGARLPVEIHAGSVPDGGDSPDRYQIFFRDISDRKRVDLERSDLLERLRERTGQIQTAFEVSTSIASTLDLKNLLNQTVEIIKQRFSFYYVGVFLVEGGEAVLAAGSAPQGKQLLEAGHSLTIGPDSMIGWSLEHRRARITPDAGKDEVRFANPALPETRSELAMPLMVHGEPIGALTVQSVYPSAFNSDDVAVLQIIADQLAFAVQHARLHARLAAYAGDLEERVRWRTVQLEILNKDLEAFSYSISHDLRTPLRAVKGYAGILLEDHAPDLSEEARRFAEKIKASADRMGELIEAILAFSKLGRQRLRMSALEPDQLVREVLEDHADEIERRGISITVENLSPVHADRALLRQVFANLVGNAIKFTRENTHARIRIGEKEDWRGCAIFVEDNGVGFSEEDGRRLFGVFQRLHPDEQFEGSGVGLAIVQRIIERHGGEVWYEAAPGAGATFYFYLPEEG
ncbi:MAG TPA: PAS domain S-box protein [Anaerolineales bacterium]|nr:PAS domain S-box protein [Anaerolineales bacterium]